MEFTLLMSEKMAREMIFSLFATLKSSRKKVSYQKLYDLLTIHVLTMDTGCYKIGSLIQYKREFH